MDFERIYGLILAAVVLVIVVVLVKFFGIVLTIFIVIGVVVGGFVLLLAFTCGFHKSGRLMGGLYALIGKPGDGKTYSATHYGIEAMKQGRTVFSNYPIVSVDGKYVSRVIEGLTKDGDVVEGIRWLMKQNLNRCVIILDEAHLFFWSRNFKKFTDEDKNFFTFLGQHEISMYYIVQHEDRMDTVANDCANLFGEVTKFEIPFLEMPLFFTVTWWASESELKEAQVDSSVQPYHEDRIWFNLDTANAYDTRYFGHEKRKNYQGVDWITFKKRQGVEWHPPQHVSLSTFIVRRIIRKQEEYSSSMKEIRLRGYILFALTFRWLYPIIQRYEARLQFEKRDTIEYKFMNSRFILWVYLRWTLSKAYWTIRVWYVLRRYL